MFLKTFFWPYKSCSVFFNFECTNYISKNRNLGWLDCTINLNILSAEQNGWHLADDISKCNFMYKIVVVWLIFHQSFLTHWGRDKICTILQTTFSSAFSSIKIFIFWLKFHLNMFPRAQSTSHYLNQWWPSLVTRICVSQTQRAWWGKGPIGNMPTLV